MSDPLPPGTLLRDGRYCIESLHRMGGQSIVYKGLDVESEQQIIIKQTYHDQEWSREAIQQEAALLGSLKHQSLPQVLNCFVELGNAFLILSFIPGTDVGDLMKESSIVRPYTDVLGWAYQLLDILEYLQAQGGVVHRDINPKNVRLTSDNQVFLLDFGIASRINHKTLLVGGTPRYAPPEQLKDEGTDHRSDLYSLSATLYYLLTGIEPPDSLSRESAILKDLADPLRPACEINKEIPLLISQVLSRALSLDREQRPANAVAMRQLLDKANHGVSLDERVTSAPPTGVIDTGATDPSVRKQSRLVIPLDIAQRDNVTQEAIQVLNLLDDDYGLNPSIVQVLIEMLDRLPESRKEFLTQHSELLNKSRHGKSRVAVSLINHLADDSFIDPEVRKQLRHKAGRFLADSTLSEMSASITRDNDFASAETRLQPDSDAVHRHVAYRKWLRGLAVWAVRGVIISFVGQLILSLVTGGQSIVKLLSSGNKGSVWTVHILLLGLGVLFFLLVRNRSNVRESERNKYNFTDRLAGFLFGVFFTIVFFHDILWAIGIV